MPCKQNSRKNWRGGLWPISACLLGLTLSGCASPGREPLARNLPPPPAFAKPVAVPDPKAGESAIAVAARERAGRKRANATIVNMTNWYSGVRQQYGAK